MVRYILRGTAAVFIFLFSVTATLAQDLALVIGNKNYVNAEWMTDANSALRSARSLRRAGYTVISGRDMDRDATQRALQEFVRRLGDAERVVVMLSGHFVHSASDTWFVPVDANAPNLLSVGFSGVSLNALLELVGQKPGGAAVFLGTSEARMNIGAGLLTGIGPLNMPQGVFVATGQPAEIDRSFRRHFLVPGVGMADALAAAPDSVQGFGYISNYASILSGPTGPQQTEEQGYWQATLDASTKQAMRNYLNRYPNGKFADDAHDWIDSQDTQSPEDIAKAVEDAMALSRVERRKIQENLTLLGYDTRGVDGIFGRGTRAAISAWQGAQNLAPTGYLRPKQIRKIGNQAAVRAAELAEEARRKQQELDQADTDFWRSSGAAAGREKGLRRYLRRYPEGLFSQLAESRLAVIQEQKRQNALGADRAAWDDARAGDDIAAYEGYLQDFPQGAFAEEATSRLETLRAQETRAAEIAAAKQEEESLRMNVIARILVERRLNALGLEAGNEDGQFDKKTRRALRRFQRARDFPVTGFLTRQTLVRMIAETGG